jgi:hypothetical protein
MTTDPEYKVLRGRDGHPLDRSTCQVATGIHSFYPELPIKDKDNIIIDDFRMGQRCLCGETTFGWITGIPYYLIRHPSGIFLFAPETLLEHAGCDECGRPTASLGVVLDGLLVEERPDDDGDQGGMPRA